MDDKKFDRIAQALASDGSRRRVLGVLAGGIAALAGAATLEARRGGNGKSRSRGRGRGRSNGGNGNGGGGGQEKVTLCHRNNGKKGFSLITVGAPAVPAHEAHGDIVCELLACQTIAGCGLNEESGDAECRFEAAADDTACVTEEGLEGTCVDGECVADDDDTGTGGG
jgi:hypothetical protein